MEEQLLELPMIALKGMTIIPNTTVHFDINRAKSIKALKLALKENQDVFFIAPKEEITDNVITKEKLNPVGVIAEVKQIMKLPQNVVRVLIRGRERGELVAVSTEQAEYRATVKTISQAEKGTFSQEEQEALVRSLYGKIKECVAAGLGANKTMLRKLMDEQNLELLIDGMAEYLSIPQEKKQTIINTINLRDRGIALMSILENEMQVSAIRNDIQNKLKHCVEKNQREYVLREQLKVIKEELGEENVTTEADRYLEQLSQVNPPAEVAEKLKKEINRFQSMSYVSSESAVLRNYIETLLEYPWNKKTQDNENLNDAIVVLEEKHYGLKTVKERIVDTLAVRALNKKGNSPIICLVGPPGTGKTSIAKSIAEAMHKEYARISLGGVRDEAEIRGHRKTYVGAMPGRIVTAIKRTGVSNPLILLDEIDKVSSDYKGDTASALLEVLDGEQNYKFVDHYFEVPVDLSQVFFIATANDASLIPRPLLDRMEIIEVSSYTENEKFHIAKLYLVEKQRIKNGLTKRQFQIEDEAIYHIIRTYTREAGVRNLERQIDKLCRKAARYIVTGEKKSLRVTKKNLYDLLGIEKYVKAEEDLESKIGVVTGLAWTSVGGDVLNVEVNILDGKGALVLTGNLGDVMKESAQIALSYIRSRSDLNIQEKEYFENHDIHIHVPEGAVPKDGPSAGVTLSTAIYSAITNKPVLGNVAMTGEVTLRGHVLPIGGLKEKILAAKVAGKTKVLVPRKNIRHVKEIEDEILNGIEIIYVDTMEDVLKHALDTSKLDSDTEKA